MTIGLVFGFFSQMLIYHGLKDKNPKNVAAVLKVNPYFVKDYVIASKVYSPIKVAEIIHFLKLADMQIKGVNANNIGEEEILKELVFKILH